MDKRKHQSLTGVFKSNGENITQSLISDILGEQIEIIDITGLTKEEIEKL